MAFFKPPEIKLRRHEKHRVHAGYDFLESARDSRKVHVVVLTVRGQIFDRVSVSVDFGGASFTSPLASSRLMKFEARPPTQ